MALHDFMLPEVIPTKPELQDLDSTRLPSPLFAGVDTVKSQILLKEGLFPEAEIERGENPIASGYKYVRRQAIFDRPFDRIKGRFFIDLEDARCIPRQALYGYDFNVFQYNRRKGDRTSVLWRLRSYFEPSHSLGHPPKSNVDDPVSFLDKTPKVFWRGSPTGSNWRSPLERVGIPEIDLDRLDDSDYTNSNSRFYAVFELSKKGFLDARFTGPKAEQFSEDDRGRGFFQGHVPPSTIQEYRYVLCPAGNDVSSALYWIIRTNCVAFKEETQYEVVPDYFLQPWVHYVPISPGLRDLREKFEYCEQNPTLCVEISRNAKEAYRKITETDIWRAAETTVFERLGLLR